MIQIKRVYDLATAEDGMRFLVDRLWPRGIPRQALKLDGWLKEVAPSDALRRWYGHDPAKWPEFQRRYYDELDAKPDTWQPLLDAHCAHPHENVTLLFSSRETKLNNAAALQAYLEKVLTAAN